ncbi:DoxX family protein [Hahella ganghwensis]|uniref:DoxX family protein n=1 Tax=Hahella ganghwensis TaxID=286420 RepID=UPI00036285CF|nr:DoxX family protein [Hahella ganghwensis]
MNKLLSNPLFLVPARILLALMFILAGISKISGYEGTQGYMEAFGVPGMLLPVVILTELGLGILIVIGFQTRLAAFLLAGFSIIAALIFHSNFDDQMQSILFMKNLAVAGGFFGLMVAGPGPFSLDNRGKS